MHDTEAPGGSRGRRRTAQRTREARKEAERAEVQMEGIGPDRPRARAEDWKRESARARPPAMLHSVARPQWMDRTARPQCQDAPGVHALHLPALAHMPPADARQDQGKGQGLTEKGKRGLIEGERSGKTPSYAVRSLYARPHKPRAALARKRQGMPRPGPGAALFNSAFHVKERNCP